MFNSQSEAKQLGIIVVIPTYNNSTTILNVIDDVKQYISDIVVVNDGCTDNTEQLLRNTEGIKIISYTQNKGKGYALRCALKYAYENGYNYLISIDADGQHYANDIVKFIEEIKQSPDTLLVGARNIQADNMPSKNTFANKFSNFWFFAETGQKMSDTQSGYRLYPVKKLQNIFFFTPRYEFELEIIVRAVWKGVKVKNIPIKVYYPPQEERVSHFRPFQDFTRISILNSILVIIALLYYFPLKFIKSCNWSNLKKQINRHITNTPESNGKVAGAIGLGVFFGIVPIWGYQMVMAGVTAHFLKLNKVITVLSSNISIPPMIPFILYGSYVMGGMVINGELNFAINLSDMTLDNIKNDLLQYIVGSFVFAIICGVIAYLTSYAIMTLCGRKPFILKNNE